MWQRTWDDAFTQAGVSIAVYSKRNGTACAELAGPMDGCSRNHNRNNAMTIR